MIRYDIGQSYDWNYVHAPKSDPDVDVPALNDSWDFCGLRVDSPLGMSAGPLLNSDWIRYYGKLGFSVLTYKTVRSVYRACFGLPNLLPVHSARLNGPGKQVVAASTSEPVQSWAISFGMPSKDPESWRKDVEKARGSLGSEQVLVVSVVASPEENWTLEQIAADFTRCAVWALEAGAGAVRDSANALRTVNSISASVLDQTGSAAFGGLSRGIGGRCIRDRSNAEAKLLREGD